MGRIGSDKVKEQELETAKELEEAEPPELYSSLTITENVRGYYTMKLNVGTNYAESPQAIKGKEDTEKTDLWSIGVIAFTLLSGGMHPFDADKGKDIRDKVVQGEYSMDGPE